MAENGRSIYTKPGTYVHLLGLVAILAAIGWVGLTWEDQRLTSWALVLVLLTLFAVVAGHNVTGLWRGILIDSRNRLSLSRLQFVVWTSLTLSAFLTAVLANHANLVDDPLNVKIPSELWVLMGISTASLVAAPAVLSNKGRQEGVKAHHLLARYADPREAVWGDLLTGEERGNVHHVDLGKMQMFFFTFILALSYGGELARLFAESTDAITALPAIPEGMNVLLGISHTGYLSSKAVAHSHGDTDSSKPG